MDPQAASAFNKCTHKPLPEMEGPELEIHLCKNAVPARASKPLSIPLHWQEVVKDGLNKDEALGVIEWRTVDLQPLNRWCD